MTRLPRSNDSDVRKGAWGPDEDEKLRKYVETYGTGHWRSVGKRAGLQRCGKSCRLRWTNYLRPDIRHGSFTTEEEDLIIKLHAAHGSRWSLIAAQLPGRTDNDIKNHWNTRLKKKLCDMGIDPVTHQPIADLLRNLAGTMACSDSAGNQLAEEAARRCFSDNMLNKALREYGRPPTAPSFFSTETSRNLDQRSGNPATSVAEFHRHDGGVAAASKFEKNANPASSTHSLDEYSSSTEESLSGHSSCPSLYMGLTHSANLHHRGTSYCSNIQEPSAAGHSQQEDADGAAARGILGGREEVVYLPPPPLRLPDGIMTPSFIVQDLSTNTTHGTLQNFPPDSDGLRRSADCNEALRGMIASTSCGPCQARREAQLFGAPADPQPQARWYSSRPGDNISHDRTQFQSDMNRFSTVSQNGLMQQEPAQIHAGESVSYLQGGTSGITSLAIFRATDKMDQDGHLNITAPIQAAGVQENLGFRNPNMNLNGVPLLNSGTVGPAGPYHDILQPVNSVSDAPSQFSNSANLTMSNNMINASALNSGSLAAGTSRGTPTGLRLHEYAVIPNTRVCLWDY